MQPFKMSDYQVETYFTLRIFGMVHLVGAIVLAFLLGGVAFASRRPAKFAILCADLPV